MQDEYNKQLKKNQQIIKDYQHECEESRQAKEDIAAQLREADRRLRAAENEREQLREAVENLQNIRRQLEAEKDELEERAGKVILIGLRKLEQIKNLEIERQRAENLVNKKVGNQKQLDEINYQKKMIHNLIKWLRNLFFLSSLGVLLMYYFSNILFVKIFAIILIIISILAIILVGKAIYSGKKNINKIVDQFSFKYKNSL